MRLCIVVASALFVAIVGSTHSASADGLLAIGITDDPGRDGFVYAFKVDQRMSDELRARILEECRSAKIENTENARKACRIVGEFRNKCFAFAFDPKVGTPGVGWSIAATKAAAEDQAISKCKALSSNERANACAVEKSACDGDAQ